MRIRNLDRRAMLQGSLAFGSLGLAGCASQPRGNAMRPLLPVFRSRISRRLWRRCALIPTGCSTSPSACVPFRAQGPRIEAEQIGDTLVVHNYGHGGSGWSLSWGSANLAMQQGAGEQPQARSP